jgi:L-fucose isomerase-like protein
MPDKKITIAIAPTRRGISSNRKGAFTVEDAILIKHEVTSRLKTLEGSLVEFINIDWLNDEGMMYDVSHADIVARELKKRDIDSIFILHCNFGCEEAVGRLCKLMNKPVLLFGARDRAIAEDGSRSTDTQCGLFASSRLLKRYGIPFSYIENISPEDPRFISEVSDFIGVASVVKAFKNIRVGQINSRPKYFTSVMINESELLEKFGIEVVPINIAEVKELMQSIMKTHPELVEQAETNIRCRIDCAATEPATVTNSVCLKLALAELARKYNLSGMAIECWTVMPQTICVLPCLTIGELTDMGIPATCETDINGLIGSILLEAASCGHAKPFFGEYTMRSSEDDNTELIWHCGNAPYSMKKVGVKAEYQSGREGWVLENGDITVLRFDGSRGKYYLFVDEAEAVDGPWTTGTYLWAKVNNWPKWERKFIEGPYIHHVSVAYGQYKKILKESCKYLPGLHFDDVETEFTYE